MVITLIDLTKLGITYLAMNNITKGFSDISPISIIKKPKQKGTDLIAEYGYDKVLNTCEFWKRQYRKYPREDFKAHKDAACNEIEKYR